MRINLTDEQVFDMVAGAGATSYSWYLKVAIVWDDHTMSVTLDNGNGGIEGATLTPGTMRRAIEALDQAGHPGTSWINWNDPECDSEVDADVADQIIQQAVLGDIVFG